MENHHPSHGYYPSTHDAMTFHNQLPSSSWAGPNHAGGQQQPLHYGPSAPAFQPGSMDMQRFEPRSAPSQDTDAMKKYIFDMNVIHTRDQMRLDHRMHRSSKEVDRLEAYCVNSVRSLEERIMDLEKKASTASSEEESTDSPFVYKRGQDLSSKQLLETSGCSKEEIIKVYADQAEEAEAVAQELRKEIAELLGEEYEQRMIEGPEPPAPGDKVIGFACCEMAYGSVAELLEHVEAAHASSLTFRAATIVKEERNNDSGRTSRAQSKPRPHAIEIKAPKDEIEVKEELNGNHGAYVAMDEPSAAVAVRVSDPVPAGNTDTSPTSWTPFAVTQMKPFEDPVPQDHVEMFSWELLTSTFGGSKWSPSFYFIPARERKSGITFTAYWIIEAEYEPFGPSSPGQHGAKLTPFFYEPPGKRGEIAIAEDYENTPVFVCEKGKTEYRYLGNYSQTRFSDKVDYDRLMQEIPKHVLEYWAGTLAAEGRPQWVTDALKDHFWPRTKYDGPMPTDSALNTPGTAASDNSEVEKRVQKAMTRYIETLKEHDKEAELKVNLLTSANILDSFAKSDLEDEPGLRLFWEYLECVSYDTGMYDFLIKTKNNPRTKIITGEAGARRPPSPINDDDSTAIKKGEVEVKEIKGSTMKKMSKRMTVEERMAKDAQEAEDAAQPTIFKTPPYAQKLPDVKQQSKATVKPKTTAPKVEQAAAPPPTGPRVAVGAVSNGTATTVQPTPAAGAGLHGVGDLEEAKRFNKEVTTSDKAKGKTARKPFVAPHLRGKQ